jgi:hypothetical protein
MIKNFAKLEEKIKSVQSLAKKLHATLCNLYKIPSCNPDCRQAGLCNKKPQTKNQ